MPHPSRQKPPLCNEIPTDCHFEVKSYPAGVTLHSDDRNSNYLIFCQSGHVRITSTLFYDEILCAGEVMFVPRTSEWSGVALSDTTFIVHRFNNTVCHSGQCIFSYLYSNRHIDNKIYCCKLSAPHALQNLMGGIVSFVTDGTHDPDLWHLKHKELIWVFTRYFDAAELLSFFQPMTNEQVPFRSLVLTHYRKAEFTDKLAEMCGYGLHNFRRIFKKEFGMSPYKWLMMKRSEHIRYRLSQGYIPFADIIDEFRFSSPAHFCNFCKQYLGDTPSNLRNRLVKRDTHE
ncbi:helix-turn-helix transcriptional regulator [uncultured Bacteroides sp.]|jgi:AraC family transcriptional regulator|uniref:helix-turn-helix transcriptional regulator n=1 Tax=uncultured Bacteroides sp. TaxID=162156 RepID=UPI0025881A65|nr:helix-turn-helix transcriptional regulator [uncultured Bacteroides sp.]